MKLAIIILLALLAVSVAFNKLLLEETAYQFSKKEKEVEFFKAKYLECNGNIKRNNKFFNDLGK